MKIVIVGAAGLRTPLIIQAMGIRQDALDLTDLTLMDIDQHRLDIIGCLSKPLEQSGQVKFKVNRTTDARQALSGADYVITTFRVGGIEARVIDERVALSHGVLGQETTGPGGFSMAMRSIPVLLKYVDIMREVCPQAWLINFANPAGLMAEALIRVAKWERSVGICDGPSSMRRVAGALLNTEPANIFLDYFGLNHLGWIRAAHYGGKDILPEFIQMIVARGGFPELPFEPGLIKSLGMIPNEYLHYYYSNTSVVQNILNSNETRGEYISRLNKKLYETLESALARDDLDAMQDAYQQYMGDRRLKYMSIETGKQMRIADMDENMKQILSDEGYAGVALDVIEGLQGKLSKQLILNVRNNGAISGMDEDDVVEVSAYVGQNAIRPFAMGSIPDHCLGLMKQVKAYERLTIEAAVEGSYEKALLALTIHPLVRDSVTAKKILDGYIEKLGPYYPPLK